MTYDAPSTGLPDPMVLSSMTPDFVAQFFTTTGVSAAYSGASTAYFVPVRVSQTRTYTKAWWINGATAAGNVDVGIYTRAGTTLTRVVASTAEAQGTISVMQVAATFTATTLTPGLYYLAISCTSASATFWSFGSYSAGLRSGGVFQTATASPLPTSATAALTTAVRVPIFGFSESAAI